MAITLRQWLHQLTAPRRSYAAGTPVAEVFRLSRLEAVRAIADDANQRIAVIYGTDYHMAQVFYVLMESIEKIEALGEATK